MRCDILEVHSSTLGDEVGNFFGTPIVNWNEIEARHIEDRATKKRIEMSALNPPPEVKEEELEVLNLNILPKRYRYLIVDIEEARRLQSEGEAIVWRPKVEDFPVPMDRSVKFPDEKSFAYLVIPTEDNVETTS